jgi:phage terminase small subunit
MPTSNVQKENPHGLNDMELQFCREYIIDFNGTKAAERAGYSEKTASQQASALLTRPKVQAHLLELKEQRAKRTGITADRVVQELAKIGFSNIQDFMNGTMEINNLNTIKRSKTAAISGIKIKKTKIPDTDIDIDIIEFKLHDKTKALDLLGRHLGIYEKDNKQREAGVIMYIPDNGRKDKSN